jgi:hypothetical protein
LGSAGEGPVLREEILRSAEQRTLPSVTPSRSGVPVRAEGLRGTAAFGRMTLHRFIPDFAQALLETFD